MEGTVEARVLAVVAKEAGYEVSDLEAIDNLQADLGLDSMDMQNLQIALETEFDVDLPDKSFRNVHTVGGLIAFVLREV
jgi:acyl carrier protein